jgi:glycosyltransferase involved in cell wall biosynthesis
LFYSFIIPIYNRPQELEELLACLAMQTYKNFEVLVIEDGSTLTCKQVVAQFKNSLHVQYFFKENAGQGFARNYGMERAKGEYFIILDSDALLEPNYLEIANKQITEQNLDMFGGPDRDHTSFTPIQKAISYAMTSPFTTGGIRGSKKNLGGTFHPRSFNMGISRTVFEQTKGFKITRMGEDIELSIRALSLGFKSALLPEAYIYHKRRTSFSQFYKQLFFFGRARINIGRFFPSEVKLVHLLPSIFTIGWILSLLLLFIYKPLGTLGLACYLLYCVGLFAHSMYVTKSSRVAYLSVLAAFTQLTAYGLGFIKEKFSK